MLMLEISSCSFADRFSTDSNWLDYLGDTYLLILTFTFDYLIYHVLLQIA